MTSSSPISLAALRQQLHTSSLLLYQDKQRLLRQAKKIAAENVQAIQTLAEKTQRATQRFQTRLENLPTPSFDQNLPVNQEGERLIQAIQAHQVIIVCGETGSGKTTQLPKLALAAGRGQHGLIGHTQPRRLAARAVASRIAQELNSPLGQAVGFQVRFKEESSANTVIKIMTDGILLAETSHDRFLSQYDTLIIDEAHERSLNIDFLLGFIHQLLPKRPDLKVIITSATLDAARFSQHFNHAPIFEVSGRMFPVELRYRPWQGMRNEEGDISQEDAIIETVAELTREGSGDMLVFLAGERDIRETAEALRKQNLRGCEILPLFARLSNEDQHKIFRTGGSARRIILATNVAETSLTVPGIRFVIDTGVARVKRYSPRAKIEQLLIEPIAQSAANQRAGRCGRVASGICVRLYAEADFSARKAFTDPEILRSSLAGVILRMQHLQLGKVADFPFIDAPHSRAIHDGYQLLHELGAVNAQQELTPLGKKLATIPLDPKIARMLLAAAEQHCVTEMLIISSGLETQDPRDRPFNAREAADRAHARFADSQSDFMSLVNIWQAVNTKLQNKQSNRQFNDWCREHFLSPLRLREWRDLHAQLSDMANELHLKINTTPATFQALHTALLSGLLGQIGLKQPESGQYLGARGLKFELAPQSSVKKSAPKWVLAAELTDTGKLYARSIAKIEPEWVEKIAGHVCDRHYTDPRFEPARAQVIASERVALYGLPIIAKRNVNYGLIDPVIAREVFIRAGLVEQQYQTQAPFFKHNLALIKEIQALEHKARRPDVLVEDEVLFAFYASILPHDSVNGASFEAWRKIAEQTEPRLLYLNREQLIKRATEEITVERFPESLIINEQAFSLKYRFEPNHPLDGVTMRIPLTHLNQLNPAHFAWLVPGLIREKITGLLKNLPKEVRRLCVPVPEFVSNCLELLKPKEETLEAGLSRCVLQLTKQSIHSETWNSHDLPAHLRMNFQIIDSKGQELGMGRDLAALQQQLGEAAQLSFRANDPSIERDNIKCWDFGDLPAKIHLTRAGQALIGYPALVLEENKLAIRLFDTENTAENAMRIGLRYLLQQDLKEQTKQLEKHLSSLTTLYLQLRTLVAPDILQADLLHTICDRAFIGEDTLPRSEKDYQTQKQRARTRLPAVRDGLCRLFSAITQEISLLAPLLQKPHPLKNSLSTQLTQLIYPHCFLAMPWEQIQHVPRYIKAMRLRLEKYANSPSRDNDRGREVQELWKLYEQKQTKLNASQAEVNDFRWQIEELRVSLFAQELKTPYPVSAKRLQKIWAQLDK